MSKKDLLLEIKKVFETRSGLHGLESEFVSKPDRLLLIIYLAYPTNRLYSILNEVLEDLAEGGSGEVNATLKQKAQDFIVSGPEAKLLLKVLSESQNINQHSFSKDFFDRYTRSVSGAESQIVSAANHIVTGRRGAGKSMLLLYAHRMRSKDELPNVWVDIQTYSGRTDEQAISDIVAEILYQADFSTEVADEVTQIRFTLESQNVDLNRLRQMIPRLRRILASAIDKGELFIFIDDLHVLNEELQPVLMDILYSIARGNKLFLKISAIENLVKTYDAHQRIGVQIPQDIQKLGLDYNLTAPDKAAKHIESILDAHARYSGLPSIRRLCSSNDVLQRLTWVSAGVPRDALNLFSQAMLKAVTEDRKRVTVSNVNMAASENLSIKQRDLQLDASERAGRLNEFLEEIRKFCVAEKGTNALLVEIAPNDEAFEMILDLVQLRLLHVVSEGITPKEAGKKFIALILDYGLYVGVRAATSVELFNRQTKPVSAKELRTLPIFKRTQRP